MLLKRLVEHEHKLGGDHKNEEFCENNTICRSINFTEDEVLVIK